MDACATLDALAADPELAGRLVHREILPAREAQFADLEVPLPAEVSGRIAARGIERLYTHQAAAIDGLRSGISVAISTGTASGKSLCYQVPIVESVVEDRRDTALLIFPTKALAHDQLR
ncbi:MAG: box helicase protein, partial [Actinomycetota bacterium]|nr:box helicase protein [Actinomycetota bacterium]